MSATRATVLLLGIVAVLLGIAAAVHNYNMDQVGWNTTFTIVQTLITAILMAVVAIDGTGGPKKE